MISPSPLRLQIESTLSRKIPSALTRAPKMMRPVEATGIEALDGVLNGRNFGGTPFRMVGSDSRQVPQIDGIKLYGAHIEELPVQIRSDLHDDLRFANAAGAPDVQRYTLADERMQRFQELSGFHGLSFTKGCSGEIEMTLEIDLNCGADRTQLRLLKLMDGREVCV